jgi:hypothetical protein
MGPGSQHATSGRIYVWGRTMTPQPCGCQYAQNRAKHANRMRSKAQSLKSLIRKGKPWWVILDLNQ